MSHDRAAEALRHLADRGWTLATAESLTGGALGAALTAVPGASAVYLGGVISYATPVKVEVLHVPQSVVEESGVVSAACASAMALGVCGLLGADVGLATTGVAGPDPQEGRPIGSAFVAVAIRGDTTVRPLSLTGDRAAIRAATCRAVLDLLHDRLPAGIVWEATDQVGQTGRPGESDETEEA